MSISTTTPPVGRTLNTDDVAAKLGYRQSASVIRLVKEQGLPCLQLNGRYLFTESEVDAWLAARRPARSADSFTAATGSADPDWVAAQVAKFSPDDLRRAGELLLALSRAADTAAA